MFAIKTFGPFAVSTEGHRFTAESFWAEVSASESVLPEMFGVYIFATERPDGNLSPLYVGKTLKSFRVRLKQHFKSSTLLTKIPDLAVGQKLSVFLIAVITPGRSAVAKNTSSRDSWVDFLETALIAACMSVNKLLLNDSKTLLNKKVCVPGFLGDDPSARDDAANALARMLKSIA